VFHDIPEKWFPAGCCQHSGTRNVKKASEHPVHSAKCSQIMGRRLKFSAALATIGRNIGGSISAAVIADVHLMKSLRLTPRSFKTARKSSLGSGRSFSIFPYEPDNASSDHDTACRSFFVFRTFSFCHISSFTII